MAEDHVQKTRVLSKRNTGFNPQTIPTSKFPANSSNSQLLFCAEQPLWWGPRRVQALLPLAPTGLLIPEAPHRTGFIIQVYAEVTLPQKDLPSPLPPLIDYRILLSLLR